MPRLLGMQAAQKSPEEEPFPMLHWQRYVLSPSPLPRQDRETLGGANLREFIAIPLLPQNTLPGKFNSPAPD